MKIAVAMSGGVDSSAAAAILKEQGHELVGFTMQLWNQRRGISVDENGEPLPSRCCSLDDVYDARRVAEGLGFPFYVLNLENEFERDVVQPFVASYLNGETPIPCVACNSRLKFASLDRLAASLGCEKVATGHYARVEFDAATNRYRLLRGRDPQKDQSYFLWGLTQDQLARSEFPLGELSKDEVRAAARRANLPVADKPESMELCFVPNGNYVQFIEAYSRERGSPLSSNEGEIVTEDGTVVGHHGGVHNFTIGQRKGLGFAAGKPFYVVAIDRENNRVVVGDDESLRTTVCEVQDVNWISLEVPAASLRASVKIRHKHVPAEATITAFNATEARIVFDTPQRAITSGQGAVFYDGERVLGGGWIR